METISGFVDHIIYQNEENGYTVCCLVADGENVDAVGHCRGLTAGETIEAQGEYTVHPTYGRQFRIRSYRSIPPQDKEAMERYLASGAVKGIGAALAARIVGKFGDDSFRIIEEEPERLAEIKGISRNKAQEIAAQMEAKRDQREAFLYLQKFGISGTLVDKIYHTYGEELYGVMRGNPYRLVEDIRGVGFKTADEIASKIGIRQDSEFRIRSGICYAMQQSLEDGHVYLPMELLLRSAAELLGVPAEEIRPQLDNLTMDRKLVIRQDKVFLAPYFRAEQKCAAMLHRLNVPMWETGTLPAQEAAMRLRLERLADELGMELDEQQLEAVRESVRNGLFILSGGPGTGKTTTINMMLRYFEDEGLDIMLAAPTGRAAKRMTEATGFEARTIHRLLELDSPLADDNSDSARFKRNEDSPLETDVLIIDEMSMVDIQLFQSLLKAVMPGTRLILVGDVDQLPSVGPGQVLRDLMTSGCFPMVVLQKIFRQAGTSDIVVNAHKINRGEQIALDNKSRDFFFLERNDVNVIYKHMVQLIREKLPKYVNASSMDIQVLTPMRKGLLGCETLNTILQEYLNPPESGKREHVIGGTVYREGDKVMQIRNDYRIEWEIVGRYNITVDKGLGVFNGDVGRILGIDEAAASLVVEFDEHRRVTYPFQSLEELELAYAMTIHKSQGSEYPAVILPLLPGPPMLFNRNLLYTAITRARSCVTILGSSETVRSMIANEAGNRRYTALADRIRETET